MSHNYRVTSSEVGNIDGAWLTVEFNDRPHLGETFYYQGTARKVMAIRVIAAEPQPWYALLTATERHVLYGTLMEGFRARQKYENAVHADYPAAVINYETADEILDMATELVRLG